jgi:hypothetical protein
MLRMLREREVLARVAMGKTKFKEAYVDTKRVKWVRDGRIKRLPEHEVDRIIREDIEAAKAETEPPEPALPESTTRKSADQRIERAAARAATPPTTTPERRQPRRADAPRGVRDAAAAPPTRTATRAVLRRDAR